MNTKKENPKTKKENPKTKKENPKTKDNVSFIKDLEDRFRQEARPPASDNSQLIKAAEDWIVAHGFDPHDSERTIRVSLLFNFLKSGKCEIAFSSDF